MTNIDDIIGGLKNAIEKGDTLEQAKQSFFNAGYSHDDVEEAARSLHSDSSLVQEPESKPQGPEPKPLTAAPKEVIKKPVETPPEETQVKEKSSGKWKLIVLISVLVALIILFIFILIFKDKIIGLFT